jgi:hypothetical protein
VKRRGTFTPLETATQVADTGSFQPARSMDLRPLSAVFGVSVNQIWLRSCAQNWRSTRSSWTQGSSFPVQSSLLGEDRPDAFLSAQSGVRLLAATALSQDTAAAALLWPLGAGFLVSGEPSPVIGLRVGSRRAVTSRFQGG